MRISDWSSDVCSSDLDEEIFFLNSLCMCLTNRVRVAELGCYVGGTTSIFGEASPDGSVIEVYDLFEHNAASRERLKDDPDSDEKSFFRVWERNIRAYRSKIHQIGRAHV